MAPSRPGWEGAPKSVPESVKGASEARNQVGHRGKGVKDE